MKHQIVKCHLLQIKPTWCRIFLGMFISILYMFRATVCPSSGGTTVFMRHLVLVILCGWLSGMQGEMKTAYHTVIRNRITSTKCRINTVVSPDDGHIVAPKHVRTRNKHTQKNCAPSWLYLEDYTGMHSEKNIKFGNINFVGNEVKDDHSKDFRYD